MRYWKIIPVTSSPGRSVNSRDPRTTELCYSLLHWKAVEISNRLGETTSTMSVTFLLSEFLKIPDGKVLNFAMSNSRIWTQKMSMARRRRRRVAFEYVTTMALEILNPMTTSGFRRRTCQRSMSVDGASIAFSAMQRECELAEEGGERLRQKGRAEKKKGNPLSQRLKRVTLFL